MSVNIGQTCGGIVFETIFTVTSREPKPWTKKIVTQVDGSGNPIYTEYYWDTTLVFSVAQTWQGTTEMTYEIYQP